MPLCNILCMRAQSLSHVRLFRTLSRTIACQALLSIEFSRQEYWSGLPFLSPGDLPVPGIKPMSPALVGEFFSSEPQGKPLVSIWRSRYRRSIYFWLKLTLPDILHLLFIKYHITQEVYQHFVVNEAFFFRFWQLHHMYGVIRRMDSIKTPTWWVWISMLHIQSWGKLNCSA